MSIVRSMLLLALVLGASCEIPEVERIVAEILDHFDAYVHFNGSHSDTHAISRGSDTASILPRQSTPYWYEDIDHRGISAFGPSGYVVYRNVMDYGATGKYQILYPQKQTGYADLRRERSN